MSAFNSTDVFALDVLDEGELKARLSISLPDDDGNGLPSGDLSGTQTAFARYQLILSIADRSDDEGLNDSKFSDRVGEFRQGFVVEL